jgi:hypothetical protein
VAEQLLAVEQWPPQHAVAAHVWPAAVAMVVAVTGK